MVNRIEQALGITTLIAIFGGLLSCTPEKAQAEPTTAPEGAPIPGSEGLPAVTPTKTYGSEAFQSQETDVTAVEVGVNPFDTVHGVLGASEVATKAMEVAKERYGVPADKLLFLEMRVGEKKDQVGGMVGIVDLSPTQSAVLLSIDEEGNLDYLRSKDDTMRAFPIILEVIEGGMMGRVLHPDKTWVDTFLIQDNDLSFLPLGQDEWAHMGKFVGGGTRPIMMSQPAPEGVKELLEEGGGYDTALNQWVDAEGKPVDFYEEPASGTVATVTNEGIQIDPPPSNTAIVEPSVTQTEVAPLVYYENVELSLPDGSTIPAISFDQGEDASTNRANSALSRAIDYAINIDGAKTGVVTLSREAKDGVSWFNRLFKLPDVGDQVMGGKTIEIDSVSHKYVRFMVYNYGTDTFLVYVDNDNQLRLLIAEDTDAARIFGSWDYTGNSLSLEIDPEGPTFKP